MNHDLMNNSRNGQIDIYVEQILLNGREHESIFWLPNIRHCSHLDMISRATNNRPKASQVS